MKEDTVDDSNQSRSAFLTKFLAEQSIPAESLSRFASIPWTDRWLRHPAYKCIPTFSRYLKHKTGEDFFFARTINTAATIPHMVSLILRDPPAATVAEGSERDADVVLLLDIGRDGVNGHPGIVHGGVCSAILDEAMGTVVMIRANQRLAADDSLGGSFTANLSINFRAPVTSPGVYAVKCWFLRTERRKSFTRGVIVDQHDRVLVQADAIWVTARAPTKL